MIGQRTHADLAPVAQFTAGIHAVFDGADAVQTDLGTILNLRQLMRFGRGMRSDEESPDIGKRLVKLGRYVWILPDLQIEH